MSAVWIAVLVLATTPSDANLSSSSADSSAAAAQQPVVPLRKGPALGKAAHEALRRWAKPKDEDADQAARELLVVYRELQVDKQLPRAERDQLRSKVRGRLALLAQQIGKRVATEQRLAKADRPKSVGGAGKDQPLAQFGGFGGQRGGMGGQQGVGQQGGMGGMPGFGGQMAADEDAGQQLVDVIQKTISPSSWDVNGGLGSIYYWRPGRAIAVSATDEVHENIANLIEQLDRAGR